MIIKISNMSSSEWRIWYEDVWYPNFYPFVNHSTLGESVLWALRKEVTDSIRLVKKPVYTYSACLVHDVKNFRKL